MRRDHFAPVRPGWCTSEVPTHPSVAQARPPWELARALALHPDLARLELTSGTPEHRIRFDTFGGEPRHASMATGAPIAITIRAKAD
jgi:hypothetical protein